nr:zinc finger protein 554-like [Oncorhynchus nerka]
MDEESVDQVSNLSPLRHNAGADCNHGDQSSLLSQREMVLENHDYLHHRETLASKVSVEERGVWCESDVPVVQQNNLDNTTSSTKKSFPCSVCGRLFTTKQSRDRHMKTHTGEKPFHCTVCGKSFSQQSSFRIHQKSHTGEKPYRCLAPDCGKSFYQSGALLRHGRGHAEGSTRLRAAEDVLPHQQELLVQQDDTSNKNSKLQAVVDVLPEQEDVRLAQGTDRWFRKTCCYYANHVQVP